MSRYDDHSDEFARADAREKELQRQLGMDDGISSPRPANTQQQNFNGYNNYNYNNNYNPYNHNGTNGFAPAGPGNAPFYYTRPVYDPRTDPRVRRKAFTIISVVFFGISLILITIMMIVVLHMRKDYKNCTVDVEATYVGSEVKMVKRSRSNVYRTMYYAVYRYEYNSQQYRGTSKAGSTSKRHAVGDKVTIHIDPDDPTHFYDIREDYLVIAILSSIAGFFFLLALIFTIVGSKMKKRIQSMMQ